VYILPRNAGDREKVETYQLYIANGLTITTRNNNVTTRSGPKEKVPVAFHNRRHTTADHWSRLSIILHLLPDMKKKKLIDGKTELAIQGLTTVCRTQSVKTVIEQTQILTQESQE